MAASGFTSGFLATLAAERKSRHLVVPIDRTDLQRLVEAPDRSEVLLKELHRRTIELSAEP